MTFLLDTNVISEWAKPSPHAGVVAWLDSVDEDQVFVSVATIAELRFGTARLPAGKRRRQLEYWLEEELPLRFVNRILPIDLAIAHAWGYMVARGKAAGRSLDTNDAFIGATAETHGLTLVTRDVADFKAIGMVVLNPWTADQHES